MKNHTIIRIGIILMILMGSGCNEDWLAPKPLSFYAPENMFINEEGLNAALIACLRSARFEYFGDGCPLITENIFADIAVRGCTDSPNPSINLPAQILPDANLNANNANRIGWYWQEGYNRIKFANIVISRIDVAKWKNEAERNNVLGKAYFHRARVYYQLTHQFGDVPLILSEITEPKLDFYSTSRESILKKCKKDLEFAAQWVYSESQGVPVGDVNKAAVYHLLTKVNLALLEFDDAIASASAVINDGYYHLMTTRFGKDKSDPSHDVIWDLHQVPNKSLSENRERIYLFTGREDLTAEGASEKINIMRNTVPYWGGTGKIKTPTGGTAMSEKPAPETEFDLVTKYGRGIGRCRLTPYSQYELWDDPNDFRHISPNWMRMEDLVYNHPDLKKKNDPYYGKHLQKYSSTGAILCTDTIRSWFNWPYYKLYVADPTALSPVGGYGDWYCYRLAETYLLRAEAYFWKNDLSNAAADINAVRTRANCAPYTAGQINIGTILDERARELYFEEPRKTEITRIAFIYAQSGKICYNGKTYSMNNFSENNFWYDRVIEKNIFYRNQVVAPQLTYKAAPWLVLWPVPAVSISANSLGIINQNIGYPGTEKNVPPLVYTE